MPCVPGTRPGCGYVPIVGSSAAPRQVKEFPHARWTRQAVRARGAGRCRSRSQRGGTRGPDPQARDGTGDLRALASGTRPMSPARRRAIPGPGKDHGRGSVTIRRNGCCRACLPTFANRPAVSGFDAASIHAIPRLAQAGGAGRRFRFAAQGATPLARSYSARAWGNHCSSCRIRVSSSGCVRNQAGTRVPPWRRLYSANRCQNVTAARGS